MTVGTHGDDTRDQQLIDTLFRPGAEMVRTLLQGQLVDVVARLDQAENERRGRCGLGAVAYPRLLRSLAELPRGVLVEDALVRAELHLLPAGIVDLDGDDSLARALAPPLTIEAIVISARNGPQARHVDAASRYATYFRRWVVGPTTRLHPAVRLAASVYGVGLATSSPAPRVIVDAGEPMGDGMPEWAWCFAEQTYAAWLTANGGGSRRTVAEPAWLIPSS